MDRRAPSLPVMLAVVLALAAGCGDGGNGAFDKCGNGVVDGGEECDDGNLIDQDSCLATCQLNVCGDTFRNAGVEECDGADFGGRDCTFYGFANQNGLTCSSTCTIDTSGCSGTPQPTATPGGPGATTTPSRATPTQAASGATPTPTPVSSPGGTCSAGDTIVVTAALGLPYSGVNLLLVYPPAANIPGSGTAQSVKDRVAFANSGGLATAGDLDKNADGTDETLSISVVDTSQFPAGDFVTVTFDCLAGDPRPDADAFACTVASASLPDGTPITGETCTLAVR